MAEIVTALPFERPIKEALCSNPGSARYAEAGHPEDADTLVQPLNPRRDNTIGAFREAVTRVDRMISRKYGD